ncbi:DUF6011 domain-containing protein [Nocardia beijingensis]|uniref:DUF6011 domain-containing protein n=1 Tax=Nocardia beijingensis TaxID=95162 RepID=A0ABW7WK89_9NOCA
MGTIFPQRVCEISCGCEKPVAEPSDRGIDLAGECAQRPITEETAGTRRVRAGAEAKPEHVGAPCHTGGVVTWPEENELAAIDDRPMVRLVAHCRRCHGWLLSPQSVAEGIGPTCAIRERAELRARSAQELTLFDVAA